METIKVLIENYNRKSKRYELGKQEICDITANELRNLLIDFPCDNNKIPAKVITDSYIFSKTSKNTFMYQYNHRNSILYFYNPLYRKQHKFKLKYLDTILNQPKLSSYEKFIYVFQYIYCFGGFMFPILNIIILGKFFIIEIQKNILYKINNLLVIAFFSWLLIFCLYSLYYFINEVINLKNNPQKIKTEYCIPILNNFEIFDLSGAIIFLSNFSFVLIIQLYSTFLDIIILLTLYLFILSLACFFLYSILRENNTLKEKYLKYLYKEIQNADKFNYRLFLYNFTVLIKTRPKYNLKNIPKFLSFLSFFIVVLQVCYYFLSP